MDGRRASGAKKEGNETGRNGITLADWQQHKGGTADDARTNAMARYHNRTRDGTNRTDISYDTEPRHTIWEPGQWAHSSGSKRKVHVPDEHRNAKRYGKNNGRQLELITYNAMYAANGLRIRDISQTFPRAVVGIQGAKQKRDPDAPAYRTRKTGGHVVYDFPHTNVGNRKGGPPAGVAIFLPTWMAAYVSMIKYPTERRLQGRGGNVRVKLPDGRDYAFITVYARVEEPGGREDEVNTALWEWVDNELRELPIRSTPVIFTDANGHTGKGHVRDKADSLHGIGPEGAERENKNGKLLREFCERTDMIAINTWWHKGGGATYFSAREIGGRIRKYATRIDYVLIPKGEFRRIRHCRVLMREGLQLLNAQRALCYLIDRVPLRAIREGQAIGEMTKTLKVRRRLDREGLAWEAQQGGTRRTQLTQTMQ